MSAQENIAMVKECYAAFAGGQAPELLDMLCKDVDWELPTLECVAFSGKRQGREQVMEVLRQEAEVHSVQKFEPQEFIAQGETVVVLGHYAWSVHATGAVYESDWAHVFRIRDGKVASFREFSDTHAADAAYRVQ